MKKYTAIAAAILVLVSVAAFGAGDFNKPSGSSLRTGFMQEIRDMFADQAKWFAGTSTTNYPTGAIRLNETSHLLEKWNGSTWNTLDLTGLTVSTATNATNAVGTGTALYSPGETGLRIVRGEVNSTGGITRGSGFTVSHAGTGYYVITLTESNKFYWPTPVVSLHGSSGMVISSYAVSSTEFRVDIQAWNGTTFVGYDWSFNFIVAGQL